MNSSYKTKLVPELRFPEFSGEWEEKKLREMLGLVVDNRGKTPPTKNSGTPLIEVNALGGKFVDYSAVTKYVDDDIYKQWFRKHIQSEDILFTTVGKTALCSLYLGEQKATIAQNIVGLRFDKEVSDFMFYLLSEKQNRHKFKRIEMGAVQPSVKVSQMVKIKFTLPTRVEQKKIASFLSSVDVWIENLRKQKKELEKYKKGMMQKIFSQEIRFKPVLRSLGEVGDDSGKDKVNAEGREGALGHFPKWEERKLSEVFYKKTERNVDSKTKFVLTNSATKGIVSQFEYFDKDIANKSNLTNYYIVDIDDFVYNPRISKHAPVGPLQRNKLKKGIMSPLYTILKINEGITSFYEKYFETSFWHRYMYKIANYGARHDRMNILQNDFLNMPIPFPTIKEQQKIAEFLSSLDTLIESKQKQITHAENWKKGLMQRMFV